MKLISDQKGIALLMVLAALTVLTIALLEFSHSTRLNYRLATQNKEKLQAYYLAKSALNFSKLLLKYNKEAEKLAASAPPELGNLNTEPIYRVFPLSSDLLRGVISGEITDIPGEEEEEQAGDDEDKDLIQKSKDEEEKEDEAQAKEDRREGLQAAITGFEQEEAEKFLDFDGDFSAEIIEEQTKFDLNRIANMEPGKPVYDYRKKLLLSILLLPKFKDLFENQQRDAETLTHALSDWVDPNDSINEFENIQRGNESSIYIDAKYEVKNGRFLTLSEMRMVAGMNDAIFSALKPFMTVYSKSGSEKMNACYAEEEVLAAMIHHFTHNANCAPPMEYDDDKMAELVALIKAQCPKTDAMAGALYSALALNTGVGTDTSSGSAGGTASESTNPNCKFQFKDLLTADNKIFTVRGTGTVGETTVNIVTVFNAENSDPGQWKQYYYRLE